MTDFPTFRAPVTATHCASNGECVICDDGAVFFSFPDGEKPREWSEAAAVPGTKRAAEREQGSLSAGELVQLHVLNAEAWEQVARNLAQVLLNTAHWLEEDGFESGTVSPTELRAAFRDQCEAHGITP